MISIVVPCYNCQDTLYKCVDSIQSQSVKEYEVVLVDDGSTDQTGKMCDLLKERNSCIKVIHQENAGLMAAWKQGVRQAAGEYIVFIDSDDWIDSDLLERIEKVISETHADVITYGISTDYSNGKIVKHDNAIKEGLYKKDRIKNEIWPVYFGIKELGTMAILPTRCNKAIKRTRLLENMVLLNDKLSVGEDDATSFALILTIDSLYDIEGYYPYHYCRRFGSMLGNYNTDMMNRFIDVRNELFMIGQHGEYPYCEQIERNFLENVLMVFKKTIANMSYDKETILRNLREMCAIKEINSILQEKGIIEKLGKSEQIFAGLLGRRQFLLCILLTKIAAKWRG